MLMPGAGCTVFEANNFQTAAHFDWLPDTFRQQTPKQGDVILFRWTGFHNVVQVHDVLQDTPVAGGITSGPKKECVGGPNYSCANGPPIQGEYLIDTQGYRPGVLHFSDEAAIRNPTTQVCWNSNCTGMNQEFQLARQPAADQVKCSTIPSAPEPACRAASTGKGRERPPLRAHFGTLDCRLTTAPRPCRGMSRGVRLV